MAKISWIVPVNNVLKNDNNEMVLDTPITQLSLRILPNNYSFSIAFGIIDLDSTKENIVKFSMGKQHQDSKQTFINTDFRLNQMFVNEDLDEKYKLVEFDSNININNFNFEHEGLHFIKLEIEDDSLEVYFTVVVKGV
ncbi:hypothetical protein [Mammaliicoccus sciuri]|uniref:Uncharacterized protein n=1 Tax=Mammaliicoccus sciuri TaxID=1296 RepID=A0ABT7HVM6_MAMSC|nr:hypothetical protein [Mammaliicoccus sciuri]MDL0112367.1 hypothetical protein [Mammaliicoccus sciuri]MDL0116199.1 hypothetical protein [Mammaliicoccus sciuri]